MQNQIIKGDCFEILKNFSDGTFDAIITDPPYMTTDLKFDKVGFNINDWGQECLRLLKPNGYLISFGSIELLGKISNTFPIRWSGVWLKSGVVMRTHTAKKPMSESEPYCVYAHPNHKINELIFNKLKIPGKPYRKSQGKMEYKRNGKDSLSRINSTAWGTPGFVCKNDGFRWQTDVIRAPSKSRMKHKERTDHPTQKPIFLISQLIKICTNENNVILDPFAGSGTLAIACLETNRRYVCIEKEDDYFEIMQGRIAKWHNDKLNATGTHELPGNVKRIIEDNDGQLSLF